jgi:hypothetical protein
MQLPSDLSDLLDALIEDKTEPYAGVAQLSQIASLLSSRAVRGAVGTYTGTGSALDVDLDFDPDVVVIVDSTQAVVGIHFAGMADAYAMKLKQGAFAYVTANGITLGTEKFTIGTDGDFNTGADVGFYLALDL